MCVAGWLESHQRNVNVNGLLTDATLKFGVFDMSASITQRGRVIWSQYSYNWCVIGALWGGRGGEGGACAFGFDSKGKPDRARAKAELCVDHSAFVPSI